MILNLDNLKKIEFNKSGIYKLENIYTHNVYIGQSNNIRKRLREHLMYTKTNDYKRENSSLIDAYNKYGENCFDFEIVEYCDLDVLNDKEILWIKYYNSYSDGYNQTIGGQDNFGHHNYSEEERKYLSDLKNPKSVLKIDFDGNIIDEYWSVAHASKLNNIDSRGIYSCCNKGISKTVKGYIWIYKDDYSKFDLSYYLNRKQKKSIEQYDLYGNLIKIWNHGCEVTKGGFVPSEVNSCCNHHRPTAHGFIWKFSDDINFKITKEYCEEIRNRLNKVKRQKICKIDMNNNIVEIYNSLREAGRNGYSYDCISKCCKGLKETYKGYKWKYYDEELNIF